MFLAHNESEGFYRIELEDTSEPAGDNWFTLIGFGTIDPRTGEVQYAADPKADPYISSRAARWFRSYFAPKILAGREVRCDGGPINGRPWEQWQIVLPDLWEAKGIAPRNAQR